MPNKSRIVRDARTVLGMTQEELAAELGCARATVHRYETGKTEPKKVVLDRLESLAAAEGAPMDQGDAAFTFVDLLQESAA